MVIPMFTVVFLAYRFNISCSAVGLGSLIVASTRLAEIVTQCGASFLVVYCAVIASTVRFDVSSDAASWVVTFIKTTIGGCLLGVTVGIVMWAFTSFLFLQLQ